MIVLTGITNQNEFYADYYLQALVRIRDQRNVHWASRMRRYAPVWFVDAIAKQNDDFVGEHWAADSREDHAAMVWSRTSHASTQSLNIGHMQVGLYLDDHHSDDSSFKRDWNGFLHAMNVLQFLPCSGFFCWSGLGEDQYDRLAETVPHMQR